MSSPTPAPVPAETEIWRGSPSQTENLPPALGILLLLVILTVVVRMIVSNGVLHVRDGAPANPTLSVWSSRILLLAWVAGLLAIARRVIATRAQRYRVTTQRILVTTGILSTTQEEIELRRVRDMTVRRPVLQRLFGLGNIVISGVDMSAPREVLRAVPDPEGLRDRLRAAMNEQLKSYGVRMVDYN